MAQNSDTRGPSSKKADSASDSLGQYAKGMSCCELSTSVDGKDSTDFVVVGAPGQTTEGTNVKASDQITNMQTGSADHLDMGFRKQ